MKFEMTGFEFSEFCAQVSNSHAFPRLQELEKQLLDARTELDDAITERVETWNKYDRVYSENEVLRRTNTEVQLEIRQLKALVLQLQDKLTPNRVESSYSRAFALRLSDQKIQAIKEIRALLNIGLKEAKDVVEGGFTDGKHPNLVTLSQIFVNLEKGVPSETQCGRLSTLVGNMSAAQLASILEGTFHIDTEEAAA